MLAPRSRAAVLALLALPLLTAIFTIVGPFTTDPVKVWSGIGVNARPGVLPGYGSIDPNVGATAFSLGARAAQDLAAGTLPLWNHYEGLGTPLLGEMQSAALFPPTLLLLLPNGQMIEQFLLQAVAGLGSYLFLRQFGLGVLAALAGGLLFEFNGVFACLRNAIFAPVAFLPWLFYTVESLFCAAGTDAKLRTRAPTICLGALAAALSLYAGFPEVVYLYSLILFAWAVLRALSLPGGRAARFTADLVGVAALALVIAAPLLLAFVDFLPAAEVGGHKGAGFAQSYMAPQAFLALLMPYLYGPISAAPQVAIREIWGSFGGYLGVMPVLLAVGGLFCHRHRPVVWLLAAWVVVAVGASEGVPVLHDAIVAVPLAALASYGRYLNAGWIFCCVVLAACFIDRVGTLAPAGRRGAGLLAAAVLLLLLAIGLRPAWPILQVAWSARHGQRTAIALSVGAACLLLAGFWFALRSRRAPPLLTGLALTEAFVAFMVPFASYPRVKAVDGALLAFLQRHAGLQRVAIASGVGLVPNFGSAFGIASINYDDLPVPRLTADFVHRRLDPASSDLIFRPAITLSDPGQQALQHARFVSALPAYAAAGVRYFLTDSDLFAAPAYAFGDGPAIPAALSSGQSVTLDIPAGHAAASLRGISATIGTYRGASDGALRARLCQAGRCADGAAPITGASDNRPLPITFAAPFALAPDAPFGLALTKEGGRHDVALWTRPTTDEVPITGLAAPPRYAPEIHEIGASDPNAVLQTATTTVFEVADARPYASAPGCQVEATSHDRLRARCDAPSHLVRLELFMDGWTARVNGSPHAVDQVDEVFQGVDVPSGDSLVEFVYAPFGVRPAIPVALATVLLCLGVLARAAWRTMANQT